MLSAQEATRLTDHELVEATLQEQDNFVYLMRRFEAPLSRYLRRLVHADADEEQILLQNIFIKVYEHLNDVDSGLPFSSWIYRITRNEGIDAIRRKAREALPESSLGTGGGSEEDDDLGALDRFADDTDIIRDLDRQRTQTLIKSVIDALPGKYRDILILRYLEEKEYAEIADIMKAPLGTVSILIYRAKAVFRKKAQELRVPINEL